MGVQADAQSYAERELVVQHTVCYILQYNYSNKLFIIVINKVTNNTSLMTSVYCFACLMNYRRIVNRLFLKLVELRKELNYIQLVSESFGGLSISFFAC